MSDTIGGIDGAEACSGRCSGILDSGSRSLLGFLEVYFHFCNVID